MLGKTTTLEIQTPEGVSFQIPIASPVSRCMALAIDFAIVLALTMVMAQVIVLLQIVVEGIPVIGRVLSDFGSGAIIIFQFLIAVLYGIVTEWLWSGKTVGKRFMKLRVIDERGLALGLKQIFIRNIFRFLDILPSTFYFIGGASCFLTKRCQRVGDIAAGTLVIREVRPSAPSMGELMDADENSFATLPHLEARLRQKVTPEEARVALDAITRRNQLESGARLKLFAQLADYFRDLSDFPEEIMMGLSDEQYVRNVVDSLFRRTMS